MPELSFSTLFLHRETWVTWVRYWLFIFMDPQIFPENLYEFIKILKIKKVMLHKTIFFRTKPEMKNQLFWVGCDQEG